MILFLRFYVMTGRFRRTRSCGSHFLVEEQKLPQKAGEVNWALVSRMPHLSYNARTLSAATRWRSAEMRCLLCAGSLQIES